MEKPFKGINHGIGAIDLTHHERMTELRPTEIHFKVNGSLKNEPSFAIVMTSENHTPVVGQLTLEMFNDGLKDVGYEIVPKQKQK